MKKVFIGVGHGGADPGALKGTKKEKDMTLEVALALDAELMRHGVITKMSRYKDENDPVADEIKECNAFKPDIAVDIHFNAGGGEGFECYVQNKSSTSKILGQNIEKEVVNIGQKSRGVKTRLNTAEKDYFGFLRECSSTAIILEGCFIDNDVDIAKFDEKHETEALAVAYAKGILKTLGIQYKELEEKLYRVQVGAFRSKQNAEKLKEELIGKGYSSFITQ